MDELVAYLQKAEEFFTRILADIWNFKIVTVESNPITLGTITVGLTLLILGVSISRYLSKKITSRLLARTSLEVGVTHTLESLIFYVFVIFFTLFAMKMANLPITMFTVVGGALAIGVGFGSQNIVNNFISGLIIMIERPIKVGDFIEAAGVFGQIENIGMRSTQVRVYGNKHIIIPNSSFLEKNVLNWTLHSENLVILTVSVGVAYGSPTQKVKDLLIEAVKSESRVIVRKEPTVFFKDFGDSALMFEVLFWISLNGLMDERLITSNIRFRIDELFRQNNITIPFPQRDLHVRSTVNLPITQSSAT